MKRPSYRKCIAFLASVTNPEMPVEQIARAKSVRAIAVAFEKPPIEVALKVFKLIKQRRDKIADALNREDL